MTPRAEVRDVLEDRVPFAMLRCSAEELLAELPDGAVDHVVTDPPFSARVHAKQRRQLRGSGGRVAAGQKAGRGQIVAVPLGFEPLGAKLQRLCAREFVRVVVKGWIVVKADSDVTGPLWYSNLERAGAKRWGPCAWVKAGASPSFSGQGPAVGFEMLVTCAVGAPGWAAGGKIGVYSEPVATDRNQTGARFHATQTPVGLWMHLLRDFARPGQVVLDPFAGSGSVGEACLRLGMRYIGCDFDAGDASRDACPEPYADRARERIRRVWDEMAGGKDPRAHRLGEQAVLL